MKTKQNKHNFPLCTSLALIGVYQAKLRGEHDGSTLLKKLCTKIKSINKRCPFKKKIVIT